MKFKELKTKSEAEIKSLLTELRIKAHDLAVKTRLNQLKNNHEIKVVKKDIARILTYVHNLKK
jgi:large subunit ribosomal protein L29